MIWGAAGLLFLTGVFASMGGVRNGKEEKSAKEVPAGTDDSYLLEFGAVWCGYCQSMKPLVEKLEKEEKVSVRQYDVDTPEGDAKFTEWNGKIKPPCPGIPLFVNTRTMNSVCGAADYETLKKWALEKPKKK